MFVHRSNRTEELLAALAEVSREPLASPFAPEIVVVSSLGMERWLSQQLSKQLGISANVRFPFPRAFVDELLGGEAGTSATLGRDGLTFAVAELLPQIARRPGAEAVASYLADDDRSLKRFELSRQIANVFDQYAVYRADLVRAWERGAGRGWQPDLWRALVARHGPFHVAARAEAFLSGPLPSQAPERVSIFGASALPRVYVRILARLARERAVHVFLLCPSGPGARGRSPLASSLGALGHDFEHLLLEESPHSTVSDRFVAPGARTILEVVQADLLSGRTREPGSKDAPRATVRAGDSSLSIHSCHSPLREVEVLRDQLLSLFEADATLEPHDVIVMAPDIDAYAPLIDAVFGRDADEPGYLPYRIADRRIRAANPVAEALLRILALIGVENRMKASDVLDLLQLEPVRDRFGIPAESLAELRQLVTESQVRWGIDAAHRQSLGQPPRGDNTWRFGLDRLLLGVAFEAADDLYAGALPLPIASNATAELVGRLAEATELVFRWQKRLDDPRPLSEWASALEELLTDFVSEDDVHVPQVRAVREAVAAQARHAAAAHFGEAVPRDVVVLMLEGALDSERIARSFLTGGVTFCALLPMRSIPFRVVYLLGLNDADFPRKDRAPGFDLVAHDPEVGDRSSRDEDRQLFLEALLSARERLVLSYVGRAAHDNALFPPSVVVAELLDVIDASFSSAKESASQMLLGFADHRVSPDGVGRRLVVEHPLQAFSRRYFGDSDDPRLFSYVEADADGARSLSRGEALRPRFHVAPLLSETPEQVSLEELSRFFENPSRALIQRRLGVVLDDQKSTVADREPLELDPLGEYDIGAQLFDRMLRKGAPEDVTAWIRALGLLPSGMPGTVDAVDVLADVGALFETARRWFSGERLPPRAVGVHLAGTELVGVVRELYPKAQVFVRFARLKARNELGAWVRHLALCSLDAFPRRTVVIGRATTNPRAHVEARVFEPLSPRQAQDHLSSLLSLYALGQKAPLCLFPSASRVFVDAWVARAGNPDRESYALSAAKTVFVGRRMAGADGEDAYVRRLFAEEDPFVSGPVPFDADGALGLPSFAELSLRVFEPLLDSSYLEAT